MEYRRRRGWQRMRWLYGITDSERFPGSGDKQSAYSAGDLSLIPGLERSPGEGNDNLLQYCCLENPIDRGAWWAIVHEVTKSWTWLTNTFHWLHEHEFEQAPRDGEGQGSLVCFSPWGRKELDMSEWATKKPIIVIKIFLSVCFRTMYVWCASLFYCCCCCCCCCSVAQSCPTLTDPMVSLSFTISQSLLKLMFIESEMLSSHLILCGPFLLPSIFPSIRVFSNELALCIRWPKDWSSSFSNSGLISFL